MIDDPRLAYSYAGDDLEMLDRLTVLRQQQAGTWRRDAACKDHGPNLFHPERGQQAEHARATCATCSVTSQCLEYALENRIGFGIWGGLTSTERRKHTKPKETTMTTTSSLDERIMRRLVPFTQHALDCQTPQDAEKLVQAIEAGDMAIRVDPDGDTPHLVLVVAGHDLQRVDRVCCTIR